MMITAAMTRRVTMIDSGPYDHFWLPTLDCGSNDVAEPARATGHLL